MTRCPAMSDPTTASRFQPRDALGLQSRCFVVPLLWLVLLILTAALQADETSPPSGNKDPVEQRQQLLAERDELILSANRFYQEQKV